MSAKDSLGTIVLTGEPKGRFEECIISGTPKPGTIMNMTNAAQSFGRNTYAAGWNPSGIPGPICVLVENRLLGKTINDAFTDGERGLLYFPEPGDELLCLVADVTGTFGTEALAMDDLLVPDTNGKLAEVVGTAGPRPFQSCEVATAPISGDFLHHVKYTGW